MSRTTVLITLTLSVITVISATAEIITTQHQTRTLYATNTGSPKPVPMTATGKQSAPETPAPAQTLGSSTTSQQSIIKQHTTTTNVPAVSTTTTPTPAHQQTAPPSKQVILVSATLSDWMNGTHVDSTCEAITVTSPTSVSTCTAYTRAFTPQKQYCIYTYSNSLIIRSLYSTRDAYDDGTYSNPSPPSFPCDTSTPPTIQ